MLLVYFDVVFFPTGWVIHFFCSVRLFMRLRLENGQGGVFWEWREGEEPAFAVLDGGS